MKEIIKSYQAKLGTVELERWSENGKIEYHVKHSHPSIQNTWHDDKREAILRYQFLSGKY